jgi:diguanylate cyclase (GGDEF)-like protein
VVVPDASSDSDIAGVAEKLREALASLTLPAPDRPITMTASIGGCLADARASIDAMLRSTDDALYAAKGAGRNRIVVGKTVPASKGIDKIL